MSEKKMSARKIYLYAAYEVIIGVVIWQLLAHFKIIPAYLSSPSNVGAALWQLAADGQLVDNAFASLKRSLTGFLLVALIGTALGILAGQYKTVGDFFDPIIGFLNPLPKIALLPLFIIWFGLSDSTRVLLIFSTAFFPAFISTMDGARSVNKQLIWSALNMGASRWRVLFQIVLPASLSKIFDGLRVALGLSFVMMFSSEMIGSSNGLGLGFLILKADVYGQIDTMFAAIIMISLLGCAFDFILQSIRKRVLWWADR